VGASAAVNPAKGIPVFVNRGPIATCQPPVDIGAVMTAILTQLGDAGWTINRDILFEWLLKGASLPASVIWEILEPTSLAPPELDEAPMNFRQPATTQMTPEPTS
jgi:hypothetical protein